MKTFTAAAVQLRPEPGPLSASTIQCNVEHATETIARCVSQTGAQLVGVPEAVTTGFDPGMPPSELADVLRASSDVLTRPAVAMAAELEVHIVWTTYQADADGHVFNSAMVISPEGKVLSTYNKTHLFPGESVTSGGWVTPGEQVAVAETELARIGTVICFDGDYPELCRIEAVLGAEVLVRPSALLRSADIWELTCRARAYDNHVFVLAPNAVGADPAGNLYFGNSLIVGPTAEVLARGTTHEGWISAALPAHSIGAISPGSSVSQGFHHVRDRNISLYSEHARELLGPASNDERRS